MANTIATTKPAQKPAQQSQPSAAADGTKSNPPSTGGATTLKTTVPKKPGAPAKVLNAAVPAAAEAETLPGTAANTPLTLSFFDEDKQPLPQGKYGLRPLNKTEMDELETCETIVRENLPKFLAVGQALLRIKSKKLWRMYCRSWREYLDTRLGISQAYASMQASAAEAMQNLITNGEQAEQPSTERQLRPLVGLSPENQMAAWNLAVTKAAGKKVTGKIVEEAVAQVLGDDALLQGWLDTMRHKLVNAGYETSFEQPVDLGDKTWVDLLNEETGVYVKLIDVLTLENVGTCYAMKDRNLPCQVVINGASVAKRKLEMAKDGTLSRLLDPVLSVFVHSLGAYVETEGRLYEADKLGDDFKLALKPSDGEEANDLRSALAPQQGETAGE